MHLIYFILLHLGIFIYLLFMITCFAYYDVMVQRLVVELVTVDSNLLCPFYKHCWIKSQGSARHEPCQFDLCSISALLPGVSRRSSILIAFAWLLCDSMRSKACHLSKLQLILITAASQKYFRGHFTLYLRKYLAVLLSARSLFISYPNPSILSILYAIY